MNQYKLSDELEIYEMDYIQNHNLQEVCEMKQPIIFQFEHIHPELFETMKFDTFLRAEDAVSNGFADKVVESR